jgi:hypothetical protein
MLLFSFWDGVTYSKLINVVSVGFTCIENHVLPTSDEAESIWSKFSFIRPNEVGVFSTLFCLGFVSAKKLRLICTSFCVAAESAQETLSYALIF